MEIMLFDLTTGDIISQKGAAWDMEARDLIDSAMLKAFSKLKTKIDAPWVTT